MSTVPTVKVQNPDNLEERAVVNATEKFVDVIDTPQGSTGITKVRESEALATYKEQGWEVVEEFAEAPKKGK